MDNDNGGWAIYLLAAIIITIAVILICGCIHVEDAPAAMLPPDEVETTEHAPGMPLDAIAYDAPEWMPGCYKAYRIYDRTNGEQWWVLVMWQNYVVLPIGGVE